MRPNLRKYKRQPLHYRAYVDLCDGTPARPCQLVDVSQHGAQLTMALASALPDRFALLLDEAGKSRRWCHVIWRSEKQVGLQFLAGPPKQAAMSAVAKLNA